MSVMSRFVALFSALLVVVTNAQNCGVDPNTVSNPIHLTSQVTLDRVRACRGSVLCWSYVTRSDYTLLDDALSNSRAKKLFLSQVNNPRNARNAVIVLGGQRANESHDDNGLTGQVSPYRLNGKTSSRTVTLRSDSYAKRLLDLGYFSADDTFVGLVFDARFPYEYGSSAKTDLVRGYFNYIVSKLGNRARDDCHGGQFAGRVFVTTGRPTTPCSLSPGSYYCARI